MLFSFFQSGDYQKVVKRVCRWVENLGKGKEDHRQTFVDAEFIEGGTIGPVVGIRLAGA